MDDLANELYKQAIVLSELRNYQKVVSLLGPHLSALKDSFLFFHALFKLKQYDDLLHLSQKIGPDDAKYVGILQLRALSFLFLRNGTEARREIMTAVGIEPNDAFAQSSYASIQCALGDFAGAHCAIMRAISLEPEEPWHHLIHAFICLQRKQKKPAIGALENVLSLDPENGEALYQLSLLKKNKNAKHQLLQRALQLAPNCKRYQNQYDGIADASSVIPQWLHPAKYPIHIYTPLKLFLVCFCFLFAFRNPGLAQSISDINDPVYIHHTLYIFTFALIIRNFWLAELLLVLCILLFSRPIVVFPQSSTVCILTLQIMASVILLPLIKPMFFNLGESCRDLWHHLRLLPANRDFFKSLYVFFEERVEVIIPTNITLWFLVYQKYEILLYGVIVPFILAGILVFVAVIYVVLTNLLEDFDRPFGVLWRGFKQCTALLFPLFATFIIYCMQLILFTAILYIPLVADIAYPYLAAIVSFVICTSSNRFYFLAWHYAIPEIYEMQPNKSSLSL